MKSRNNLIIFVVIISICFTLFYFFKSDIQKLNIFSNKTDSIPMITPTGASEDIPAVWVWLGSTKVIKESDDYYLQGNIGDKRNLTIKVFLGSEETDIGYASTNNWGTKDANFAERYPEFSEQKVSKVETDSATSNYAIVKILVAPIPPPAEMCDEYCNYIINKQAELLVNNQKMTSLKGNEKLDGLVIGPVIQMIQILDI